MDNIIVPGERQQQGYDEMKASFFDKDGNKYVFILSLRVIPKGGFEPDDTEEGVIFRLDKVESDVNILYDRVDFIEQSNGIEASSDSDIGSPFVVADDDNEGNDPFVSQDDNM